MIPAHSFTGEFNYDYIDANPGILRGYVFTVRHRGHAHCGCMRGKPWVLFMVHNGATGDFPMHFQATEYRISEYLQQNNLQALSEDEFGAPTYSHGWICEGQLHNHASSIEAVPPIDYYQNLVALLT